MSSPVALSQEKTNKTPSVLEPPPTRLPVTALSLRSENVWVSTQAGTPRQTIDTQSLLLPLPALNRPGGQADGGITSRFLHLSSGISVSFCRGLCYCLDTRGMSLQWSIPFSSNYQCVGVCALWVCVCVHLCVCVRVCVCALWAGSSPHHTSGLDAGGISQKAVLLQVFRWAPSGTFPSLCCLRVCLSVSVCVSVGGSLKPTATR